MASFALENAASSQKRSNCPADDSICHLAANLTLIRVQHARQICPFVVKIIFRQIILSQIINASAKVVSTQRTHKTEQECSKKVPLPLRPPNSEYLVSLYFRDLHVENI